MPVFRFLRAIAACPKVVIAGVEGLAIGIGTTMLLHCDLVLAASGTTFSMPFVNLGLVPEAASSLLLPRLIRSEEHTSELQSLMRISYAIFCLKKKTYQSNTHLCYKASVDQAQDSIR